MARTRVSYALEKTGAGRFSERELNRRDAKSAEKDLGQISASFAPLRLNRASPLRLWLRRAVLSAAFAGGIIDSQLHGSGSVHSADIALERAVRSAVPRNWPLATLPSASINTPTLLPL